MSNTTVAAPSLSSNTAVETRSKPKSKESAVESFSSIAAKLGNGTAFSDQTVQDFFNGNPTVDEIARQAVELKLNKNEIIAAMHTAQYGGTDLQSLKDEISKFVTESKGKYAWASNGALVESTGKKEALSTSNAIQGNTTAPRTYSTVQQLMMRNAQIAKPTDTLSTAMGWGPRISIQQARDFFATNPSNDEVLKKASDLNMSTAELSAAMVFGRGDVFDELSTNDLVNNSNKFGFDNEGHIVELGGRTKMAQNGNSMLSVYVDANAARNQIGTA